MVNLALEVITETESNPPDPNVELDAGFLASFWMYPKAEALSCVHSSHCVILNFANNYVLLVLTKYTWLALYAARAQGNRL